MFIEELKETKFDNFFVQAIDGFYEQKSKADKPWMAFSKKFSAIQVKKEEESNNFFIKEKEEELIEDLSFLNKLDFNFELEETNVDSLHEIDSLEINSSCSLKDNYGSKTSFNEEPLKIENETQKFSLCLKNENQLKLKEEISGFKLKLETLFLFNLKRTAALQMISQMQMAKSLAENLKKLKIKN